MLSDIWSLGVSLIEMAIGCYPIPEPSAEQIAEEMKQSPAGSHPPRRNPHASHANAVRMPIFELLQIIFQHVSFLQTRRGWAGNESLPHLCLATIINSPHALIHQLTPGSSTAGILAAGSGTNCTDNWLLIMLAVIPGLPVINSD